MHLIIRYTPSSQLSIEEFKTPFQTHLDRQNRWVKLAAAIPRDSLAQIYYRCMSADKGAPSLDARIVIGSLIIKHKLGARRPGGGRDDPGEHVPAVLPEP